jgi:ADP-ribose pyrophosphatase YjhB (NUDIX family)
VSPQVTVRPAGLPGQALLITAVLDASSRHNSRMSDGAPVPCVGSVLADGQGRLLLIRRANEPGRGLWSLPGGRVEPGETDEQAVVREVAEETGLTVTVGRLAGRVRIGRYDVADYVCEVLSGTPVAATDATDVAWLDPRRVPTTPGLVDILTEWGVLASRTGGGREP